MAPALVNTRNYVLPEPNEEKITYLNDYLKRKLIVSATNHNTVYLHYSNKEHTYEEHVRFLIDDLTKCGYQLFCDCKEYTEHWDVSKYFPDYLLNCINENIS